MNLAGLIEIKTRDDLDRYLRRHYDGSLETFLRELNRESDRLIRTDLTQARRLSEATAGLERLVPDEFRGRLYHIWGRHAHLSGDYPEARGLYGKALTVFSKYRDYENRARVQKALLDVLAYLGKCDEAAEIGRKALRYYRRVGADEDYAKVLTNIGNLYHRLDENKKALSYYDRAYDVFKTLDNGYATALVQFNRGNIYSNLNQLDESERLYRQAAQIYRSLNMDLAAAQADYSLATISFLKGRYSESLAAFRDVGEEFRRLGDRRCLALTQLDRAEVYLQLNLYSQAIDDALAVAEEFGSLKMEYERAKALYFAAAGYLAFGDEAKVIQLAKQSLAMFERQRNRVWTVMCRFILARIDCQAGRIKRALGTFRKISAYYKRHGNTRQHYDVRLAWLEALISSNSRSAASLLARGMYSSRSELAGYQRFLLYLLSGDLHRDKGDSGQAVSFYRRSIQEAEKLQATIFPDEIRRFFWVDKLTAYNRLTALYMGEGKHRRALEVLEQGKATLNLISAGDARTDNSMAIPASLEEERQRLKAFLRKAMVPSESESRKAETAGRIRYSERRLWQIERTVRETSKFSDRRQYAATKRANEIQQALGASEKLVQYVCREGMCGAFVMSSDDFRFVTFETEFEEIRGLLARFYFLINSIGGNERDEAIIEELVSQLSARLWRPIEEYLEAGDRVLLVPDGILARLPFYILSNSDDTLVYERYEPRLSVSSSGVVDRERKDRRILATDQPLVLAVSSADLPGALGESALISRHFSQTRVFSGDDATNDALYAALAERGGLVHVAAHATQSYENHLFSQILLADGPMYSYDLIRHRVASFLVVLSGCQTGDPGLYYTSDSLSIAHAFLAAGAANVIASYWPVSDDITCSFMDRFYSHLRQNDVLTALRTAITEMRGETERFRHWAAFYLTCH